MGIVVFCLLGLLVSFQHEGALSIRRGFTVPIFDEASKLRVLPPPVITDLDGDGKNEVLLLSTRETLTVINPAQIRRSYFDFTELHGKLEAAFISNCIGFASGYLEKYNTTKGTARKQIVVAVTDDYTVFAYNHNLQMLWSERLPDLDDGSFQPTHASVMVLPHDIHREDKGLIVVGVDTRSSANPDEHSGEDRQVSTLCPLLPCLVAAPPPPLLCIRTKASCIRWSWPISVISQTKENHNGYG